jgi:hypothetical protein
VTQVATQARVGEPPVAGAGLPVISGLTISPRAFAAAGSSTKGRRVSVAGAMVSYSDSEPAVARFTVLALRSGIERPEHRCALSAPGQRSAGGRRCIYYAVLDSFARHDRAGRNRFHFSGRLGARTLAPGPYRLEAVPVFGARAGMRAVAIFRIVRR